MRTNPIRSLVLTFVATLTIFVAGCGGSAVTQSNYEQVKTGMTKAEVESILGTGKESMSSGGDFGGISMQADGMVWQDGNKIITVMFMNGEVQSKSQMGF